MKRRFTILTAALALLTFLAVPMGMWGQTKATVTDNMTASDLAATGTSYTAFSNVSLTSDAVYAGKSALNNSANIQLRSNGSDCGIVTTVSGGKIKSITINVASGSNRIDVYGKNAAYTSAEQLFNSTNQGTKLGSVTSSGTITVSGDYEYVGIRSYNGAVYISSIAFVWETTGSAATATTVTIDDSGITNTDVYVNTAAGSLSATVKENANNTTISGATVTWSSSDTNVATVDENGAVTLVAAGTTTITASYGGQSGVYGSSSAIYELTVTNSEPYVQPTTIEIIPNYTFWGKTGQFSGSTYDDLSGSQDNVTLDWSRGNGSTYANMSAMRFYKDNTLVFTAPEGYEIISIELSVSGTYSDLTFDPTGFDNETTTWTGAAETVTMSRPSSASSYATINKFTITLGLPSTNPSITAENVSLAYDAEEGTINYTINNPVEGGSIVASTEAEWLMVDDEAQTDAEGSIYFYCGANSNFYAHSATVTLTYTYGDSKATVTKDITVTQALDPDANGSTAEYPIMVSEAIEAIDEVSTVSNIYVGGIVSNIETEYSSQYHNITFDMIDEEGNEYFLRAYRCGGDEAADVTVGDEVIVYGNLVKFGEIYEFAQGCEVVSLIHPVVPTIAVSPVLVELDAEEHDGTLDLTYESLTITDMTDFDIQFCDANGDELSEEPDWIEVLVAEQDPEIGEGYVVSYYMVENEGPDARTAYFKVYAMDDETNLVYSNLVTISQAAPVVPPTPSNWVLTDLANLTADDVFVIVGDNGDTYAMPVDGGGQNGAPAAVAVTVVEGTLSAEPAANLQWNISITEDGYTFYPNGETETWLYCTNANNGVRVGTGEAKHFTLDEGYLKTTETTDQRYIGIYNSQDWRCYTNTTGNIVGQTFSFYKKVEPTPAGPSITVNGYGDTEGGYVLLAWPESTSPANIEGMISDDYGAQLTPETPDTYDLYYYDESQEKEWRNYRTNSFNLVPGKGYLYASKAGVTLTYEGVANPEFANVDNLPYTENNLVKSLYLAGNSKTTTETFYVYDGENQITFNYLVMNEDGNGFTSGQTTSFEAQPLQGFFVQAPKANTTLSTTNESDADGVSLLNVQVMRNRGTVVDNAIVSFSNGPTMKKLQLFENSTKLYIPQDNEDYAIVRSEAQGELPVSFRASENGTYTLSMNVENVDMNYLHLIDNMTGMDIDLLQTPSYTFEANTNDYANRFKLVFAANGTDEADESSFAFFSNGNLIVNNEGNATLQVIDINGRILSSETISGSCSKAINATTGVYMLRLINGDNVKVQKVVVR